MRCKLDRTCRLLVTGLLLTAASGCSIGTGDAPPPSHHHQVDPPYNEKPIAKVTDVCSIAHIGEQVVLDGTQSSDPEGAPLTYRWELVAGPVADVTLVDPTTPTPSFIPKVRGNYSFRLTVNDGRDDSIDSGPDVKSVSVYSMKPVTTAKKVAVGQYHFVALMDDGTVHGWGCNHNGQAGVGAVVSGAVDVAAGQADSLAIMPDGTVKAWGAGGVTFPDGTESCGSLPCARTPITVNGLTHITEIVGGEGITYALDASGTVWWPRPGTAPVRVTTGIRSIGIEFGARVDGTLWTLHPTQLTQPLTGIIKVSSVESNSRLVLTSDGSVWFVGLYGSVVKEIGLPPIVDIAAGTSVRLALDAQGNVWEITNGVPAQPVLTGVVDIAAGYGGPAAAVKSDGTLWTWHSENRDGELGDGTTDAHYDPVQAMW